MNNSFENSATAFSNFSDEQLVGLVKQGQSGAFNALYARYLPKIRSMVYPFQGLGYDFDDLIQEATIGFFTAIDTFHSTAGATFSTFCYLCMRRLLITLLRSKTKKGAVPQSCILYDCETIAAETQMQPEQAYITKESYLALKQKLQKALSPFEKQVLTDYLQGLDYRAIAEKHQKPAKSVDNALQRIRAKLRRLTQ